MPTIDCNVVSMSNNGFWCNTCGDGHNCKCSDLKFFTFICRPHSCLVVKCDCRVVGRVGYEDRAFKRASKSDYEDDDDKLIASELQPQQVRMKNI